MWRQFGLMTTILTLLSQCSSPRIFVCVPRYWTVPADRSGRRASSRLCRHWPVLRLRPLSALSELPRAHGRRRDRPGLQACSVTPTILPGGWQSGFLVALRSQEAIRPADAVALAMMALPGTATLMSGTRAAPVAIVAGRSVLALLSRITLTRTPEQDTRGTRRGTKRYVGLTLRVLCRLVRRSNRRCRTVGDRSEPVREDNTGTFTNKIRFPVIISCSQLAAQEKNANFHSVVYRPLLLFSIVVSAVYRTPSWSGR
jgi:hypothetical protein